MSKDTLVKVEAKKRTEGLNPRQLRAAGKLPATLYGKCMEPMNIELDTHTFGLSYRSNKEAAFEIIVDSKAYKAVVQNIQLNYSTNEMLNVEFKAV